MFVESFNPNQCPNMETQLELSGCGESGSEQSDQKSYFSIFVDKMRSFNPFKSSTNDQKHMYTIHYDESVDFLICGHETSNLKYIEPCGSVDFSICGHETSNFKCIEPCDQFITSPEDIV